MINDSISGVLETTLKSNVCRHCGQRHDVKLTFVSMGSAEYKSADATVPRGSITIAINFDEGACIPFRMDSHLFVMKETAAL